MNIDELKRENAELKQLLTVSEFIRLKATLKEFTKPEHQRLISNPKIFFANPALFCNKQAVVGKI